jgi:hypothetical protein
MPVTLGQQLKAARILLGVGLPRMAQVLGRSVDTLRRAEANRPSARLCARAMRDLLARNLVEFVDGGVIVHDRPPPQQPQPAPAISPPE